MILTIWLDNLHYCHTKQLSYYQPIPKHVNFRSYYIKQSTASYLQLVNYKYAHVIIWMGIVKGDCKTYVRSLCWRVTWLPVEIPPDHDITEQCVTADLYPSQPWRCSHCQPTDASSWNPPDGLFLLIIGLVHDGFETSASPKLIHQADTWRERDVWREMKPENKQELIFIPLHFGKRI